MTTPTKQPNLSTSILTPSCDITPTRETAREDNAYDEFASLTQNDCSEAPRDGTAPSAPPAVSVEPAYDGAEPLPASPFTYDGDGERAEREAAAYERGVNDAERTLLVPMVRKQVRTERRARFAEAVSAAVRRACLQAVGVGVLVGAAVYYFHDDGTDFQVPARAVHHAEQALVHVKLALDVARQLHLIS